MSLETCWGGQRESNETRTVPLSSPEKREQPELSSCTEQHVFFSSVLPLHGGLRASGQKMTLYEMRSPGWVQKASLTLERRQPGNSQKLSAHSKIKSQTLLECDLREYVSMLWGEASQGLYLLLLLQNHLIFLVQHLF